MTVKDREVLELLRDEPELLAIADAVREAERPVRDRRGWARRFGALTAAATALLALALVAPWDRGDDGIVERALAAVGDGPIFHSVVRFSTATRVELATGRGLPVFEEIESWVDEERGFVRLITRQDGLVLGRRAGRLDGLGWEANLFVPVKSAELYRKALEEGNVRVVGRGVSRGKRVVWLASSSEIGTWRTAVDEVTYEPVVMSFSRDGRLLVRLVFRLESLPREETPFARSAAGWEKITPEDSQVSGGGGSASSESSLGAVRNALSTTALWAGPRVGGARLASADVGYIYEQRGNRKSRGALVVTLGYGAERFPVRALEIEQGEPRELASMWREAGELAPARGFIDVTQHRIGAGGRERVRWKGVLRKPGLYVTIESWSRQAVIQAARALRPIPKNTAAIDERLAARCSPADRGKGAC